FAHNPIGRGYVRTPEDLVGRLGPELEPPEDDPSDLSRATATFAPIPPDWEPRRGRHGTFDAAWIEQRAPTEPRDADPRRSCWSVDGLWSEVPLPVDVPVEVGGVRPHGLWRFRLP